MVHWALASYCVRRRRTPAAFRTPSPVMEIRWLLCTSRALSFPPRQSLSGSLPWHRCSCWHCVLYLQHSSKILMIHAFSKSIKL